MGQRMPFVKLDTGMLNSTLWVERECRELFITALLMAEPKELTEEAPQIAIRSLEQTGWAVPPGWYGFVAAAGVGIIRRAVMDHDVGLIALEKLGAPDPESRSLEFEGRRLVRVDGGFIVLNYMKYRERDYTTAERSKRYREKKASQRDSTPPHRDITQAEAEAEVDAEKKKDNAGQLPGVEAPVQQQHINGHDKTARAILDFLNEKTGRRYQPVKANIEMIVARLKDGATIEEMRMVVAKKCREWSGDPKMAIYLRPATLFNRTKYAQYQGELGAVS